MNRSSDLGDLLIQAKITNRLLAAQLRGTMKQKELVGLLVSTGGTYAEIASVLDTSEAVVEVTARTLRNEKKGKRPKKTRRQTVYEREPNGTKAKCGRGTG